MAGAASPAELTRQPPFALQAVCERLPALDLARLQFVARALAQHVRDSRAGLLSARDLPALWPLYKAHVAETALFYDTLTHRGSQARWLPGPYTKVEGNLVDVRGGEHGDWMMLHGGTDWQGFQGRYRQVSRKGTPVDSGMQPAWVSFKVRIDTPALSCGFLTLASGRRNWGLQPLVALFGYRGDDGPRPARRFKVQTTAAAPLRAGIPDWHTCGKDLEVQAGRPYDVALHLDWRRNTLAVFIDGQEQVTGLPFAHEGSVNFVALYNWRSGAEAGFSELVMSDAQPDSLRTAGPRAGGAGDGRWGRRCRRRCGGVERLGVPSFNSILVPASMLALAMLAQVLVATWLSDGEKSPSGRPTLSNL